MGFVQMLTYRDALTFLFSATVGHWVDCDMSAKKHCAKISLKFWCSWPIVLN